MCEGAGVEVADGLTSENGLKGERRMKINLLPLACKEVEDAIQ